VNKKRPPPTGKIIELSNTLGGSGVLMEMNSALAGNGITATKTIQANIYDA